mmetsp:Transcript_34584/g.79075  ORF Transcript_34584/g.79075 Transcript_34584/m.79075 type:complete len:301 (-) Transcript_34584:53-955(-)
MASVSGGMGYPSSGPGQMPNEGFAGPSPHAGFGNPGQGPNAAWFGQNVAAAAGFNEAMGGAMAHQVIGQVQASGLLAWFPGAFRALQLRFNVSHAFVLRKMLLLMCPFVQRSQGVPSAPSWANDNNSGFESPATGNDGLKVDVDDIDLYIPVMSMITYVLIYCVQRGISAEFKPEVLSSTASFAFSILVLEVCISKLGFYLAGSTVPIADLVGNCGYKYTPAMMMVLCRILVGSSKIYYLFFLYFACCAAFAFRRFMLHLMPSAMREQYGMNHTQLQKHVVHGCAALQIPLCWLLTPSAS